MNIHTIFSPNGDEVYPGNVHVTTDYHWNESSELSIKLVATTDGATRINLTQP